ncbi:MAG: hypothetical protein WKG00_01525 [Polyangiaceae bacterium]
MSTQQQQQRRDGELTAEEQGAATAGAADDIAQYARVVAALEEPFANESKVLTALGLTRARLLDLEERWSAKLTAAGGSSELLRSFRSAYAAAVRSRAAMGAGSGADRRKTVGDEDTVDLHGQAPAEVFPFEPVLGADKEHGPWR